MARRLVGELDLREHGADALVAGAAWDATRGETELEVGADGQMRPQREILEHHGERSFFGRHDDRAGGARERAADDVPA